MGPWLRVLRAGLPDWWRWCNENAGGGLDSAKGRVRNGFGAGDGRFAFRDKMEGDTAHNDGTPDILSQGGFFAENKVGEEDSSHRTKSDG